MKNNYSAEWKKQRMDFFSSLVCDYFEQPKDVITRKSRKREYAVLRQIFWYMVRVHHENDISLGDLGRYSGNRDHSTIIYGINTVKDLMEYELKPVLEDLFQEIQEYNFYLNVA